MFKDKPSKTCQNCHKLFFKSATESRKHFALPTRVHCSRACFAVARIGVPLDDDRKAKMKGRKAWNKGTDTTLVCKECDGHFVVAEWRAKQKPQFCSHACASQYKDTGARTADKKIRQSEVYKAWRTLVFERDDYTCVTCGVKGGKLHADHIKPFAFYPELRLEVTNGRTLCVPCHQMTDTYGGRAKNYKKPLWANAV